MKPTAAPMQSVPTRTLAERTIASPEAPEAGRCDSPAAAGTDTSAALTTGSRQSARDTSTAETKEHARQIKAATSDNASYTLESVYNNAPK